jgi:hypothetical protein
VCVSDTRFQDGKSLWGILDRGDGLFLYARLFFVSIFDRVVCLNQGPAHEQCVLVTILTLII